MLHCRSLHRWSSVCITSATSPAGPKPTGHHRASRAPLLNRLHEQHRRSARARDDAESPLPSRSILCCSASGSLAATQRRRPPCTTSSRDASDPRNLPATTAPPRVPRRRSEPNPLHSTCCSQLAVTRESPTPVSAVPLVAGALPPPVCPRRSPKPVVKIFFY